MNASFAPKPMTRDALPSSRGELPEERWIETRRGGLFFVNALLIFPHVMVSVPLLTRMLVRARGGLAREAEIVDTFPMLAEHLLPRMGWLLVVPIGLILLNLRLERALWPRLALLAFLALHLAYLGWTIATWVGATSGTFPGGPP